LDQPFSPAFAVCCAMPGCAQWGEAVGDIYFKKAFVSMLNEE